MTSLPDYVSFNECEPIPFENIFTAVKDDMIKLLKTMLVLNPVSRCTCSQALQMPYFSNEPAPTSPQLLPQPSSSNQDTDVSGRLKRPNLNNSTDKLAPTAKRLNFDE